MDGPYLHIANILYLASYSVRDILWLRVLTVLAMLCMGGCYWMCGELSALGWQGIFLLINLVQIGLLIYERRPVSLTDTQRQLYEGPLASMTPRQVQRFTDKAEWCTFQPGEQLLAEDSHLQYLILILSGTAKVQAAGKVIARLEAGQFAGEMSFLTGNKTSAAVVAIDTVLVAKWPEAYVTDLMRRDHELGTALQASLGTDLVKKLLRSRDSQFS